MVSSNPFVSAFSMLGFILITLMLPMHLRARNVGTCLFIIWTSLLCLNYSVNSIVWNNNVVDWAPVWCDISSRIIIAASGGQQAASLCIVRRLYRITTMKAVNQSRNEVLRDLIVDLCIGVGLPLLLLPLQYIVEDSRYMIVEEIGCYFSTASTVLAVPLVVVWPVIIALLTAIYAGLTAYAAIRRKNHLKDIIQSDGTIQFGHYWRLMALAGIGIVFTLPGALVSFFLNLLSGPLEPFNWDYIHSDFSEIGQILTSDWAPVPEIAFILQWERWPAVFFALLFFAFFGLTKEARQYYRRAFLFLGQLTRLHSSDPDNWVAREKPVLPIHVLNRDRQNHLSSPLTMSAQPLGSLHFLTYLSSSHQEVSRSEASELHDLPKEAGSLGAGSDQPEGFDEESISRPIVMKTKHDIEASTDSSSSLPS